MKMKSTSLAMLAMALSSLVARAKKTYLEVAPGQGCVLLVGFNIKTKDAGSTAELRITPYNSWTVCGHGSTPSNKYLPFVWDGQGGTYEKSIFVLYAGMAPFNDKSKAFKDFPICIRGPQHIYADGTDAMVKVEDQIMRWDGTYYW